MKASFDKSVIPLSEALACFAPFVQYTVRRFFERPDKEKQFLYQLLLDEKNPEAAIENFRQCLEMINSKENYRRYENSGFNVFVRDENRSIEDTMKLVEKSFGLI